MLDLQDFIELNEAFDSEPYLVQYDDHLANKEFYYFEEEAGKQYKIEISRNVDDDFGKSVRVLRIGYKSTGATYRRVITKFKDPKRVIATILSILNNYKVDGKYKTKTFAFAIQLTGEAFGSYSKLVKRIAKLYMRTQFNILDTDFTPSEHQYVYAIRKGKKVDDVFTGDSVPAGAMTGQAVVAEPETPTAQEPARLRAPVDLQTHRFNIGDFISSERLGSEYYFEVDDFYKDGTSLYYVLSKYAVLGDVPMGQTNVKVAIADANFNIHDFSSAPEQEDVELKYSEGESFAKPEATNYYTVIGSHMTPDGDVYYTTHLKKKSDDSIISNEFDILAMLVDDGGEYLPYSPGASTVSVAPRFRIGDFVHYVDSHYYYHILDIEDYGNDESHYVAEKHLKSDGEVHDSDVTLYFDEAEGMVVYEPSATPTRRTARFKVGDIVARDAARIYAIIRDVSEIDGHLYYTVDRYEKEQGTLESSGVTYPVEIIDGADPEFKLYSPVVARGARFSVGDIVKGTITPDVYYRVNSVNTSESTYTVTTYSVDDGLPMAVDTKFSFDVFESDSFDLYEPAHHQYPIVGRPAFSVGDRVVESSRGGNASRVVYVIDRVVDSRYYMMKGYYASGQRYSDYDRTELIAHVDQYYTLLDGNLPNLYSTQDDNQATTPRFNRDDYIANRNSEYYYKILDVNDYGVDSNSYYDVNRYRKSDNGLVDRSIELSFEYVRGFEIYTPTTTQRQSTFQVGDIVHLPSETFYNVIREIERYGTDEIVGYIVDEYRKSDHELIEADVEIDASALIGYQIYAPNQTSSNAPQFAVGDKIHISSSPNYYVVITSVGNSSYTADLYYKSTGEKFHDGMEITFSEASVYEPYTAVHVTIPNVTQQPVAQATVQTPRFSVGQYIAKRLSDYYYEITNVESDRYILKAYKKATRRHNRRYDCYILILRTTDYFRYSPTTGAFIDEPARTAPVAQPVAVPTGNFVREPNVLGDMTVSTLENHNWYQAIHAPTRKDVYIFAFNVNQGTGTADFRVYVNNGDTMFDGQITRQNIADFIEVWRIAEAPVFNRTQTPHRFNVGDNVTDGSTEYKIDGFRGIFYIVANNTEFKPISNFDASYQLVGSQQAQATALEQPSNVEGALTMAQHQQAVREARATYGITIGSDFIDKAMRHCPAVSAMDICKAMFGDSQDPDGGSRTLDWSGTTLTVTQRRGMLHGAPVQQMVRDFKFGSSERYVYHNYLAMAAGAQGGGATKKLFTESIPLYEKMGLKKVKVYANIQVGAAVWSKYGFKSYITMDEYSWKNTIDMFKGNLRRFNESIKGSSDYDTLHEAEYKSMVTLLDGLKADGYFSDYPALVSSLTMPNTEAMFSDNVTRRCDGAKEGVKLNIGKMLMWGNGFKGELDLSDRKSYNRMARYVGLPTR